MDFSCQVVLYLILKFIPLLGEEEMKESIVRSIEGLHKDRTLELVRIAIGKGFKIIDIFNWLKIGMDQVGKLYESGDYFIADLIFAGIIIQEVLELEELMAFRKKQSEAKIGKLLLFSVFGDCHDIGKNIFASFARLAGFKVIDLGINLPPDQAIKGIKRHQPDIIGLSGMQQETIREMRNVVCKLENLGIRDEYRIIIGGNVIDEKAAEIVGADFATKDVTIAVDKCKSWMLDKEKNVRK